jgi:hypothetical protein
MSPVTSNFGMSAIPAPASTASRIIRKDGKRSLNRGLRTRTASFVLMRQTTPDQSLVAVWIDAYHAVEIVLDRIDLAILGDDFEFNLRVSRHEAGRDPGQQDMRQDDWCADAQFASRYKPARSDRPFGVGDFSERASGEFMQRAALIGQAQCTRAAVDQPHAEARLKLGHLSRERRLRPAGGPVGPREAAVCCDQVEVGKRGKIHRVFQ